MDQGTKTGKQNSYVEGKRGRGTKTILNSKLTMSEQDRFKKLIRNLRTGADKNIRPEISKLLSRETA